MSPTGACGRADLIRTLASGDSKLLEATAALLGFERPPIQLESHLTISSTTANATLTVEPSTEVQPAIEYQPLLDIPFWRLEGYESVVPEEPGPERRPIPVETVVWRNRPEAPPALRLLAPWRELQPRLRAALAEPREGREIDVNLIVRRLSCGQWLDRLPREQCRRWGPCLQLVIDRSEHLVPYWTDQDQVRGELARLFTVQDLEQAVFHEGLDEPRLLGASTSGGYRPPPGGVVLVLGDLGGLTARAADEDNPWLDLGRRIAAAGGRPVALLPCPTERCPAALRRDWQLIPWERPRGSAVTDRRMLRERAERLLRLVSPAVRIEPGFLRAVRLSLGADEADAGTESDVWQHPAIASTHSDAATLDPKYTKELRAAFAAEPLERQRQILALLRVWRGPLPKEIWFEEIRDLARASLEVLPDGADLEDARRFFDSIGDRLEPARDGPADAAVGAWMGRVRARATDDFWTIDDVGTRLLRVDYLRNRHRPDYRPPVPCDPALLPAPSGQPEYRYELRQEGDELVVVPTSPTAAVSATDPGSYLGALRTVNQLVQILRTAPADPDRNAFWKSGQPPPWADDWGTDERGHWVTFSITNKQGNRVTQRMRWIEPGTFMMGSPENELERLDWEGPQHPVTISRGFWLFGTACTQALWEAVMGDNPSGFKGAGRPVENVSWNDCQEFLRRLNECLPGLDLALPSEAHWEYACRAGTKTPFSFGANITPEQVNYDGNNPYAGGKKGRYRQETVLVASLPPNPWGLYEMHGNVYEWTQDHWHDGYRGAPTDGSAWESGDADAYRVLRGGSWNFNARAGRAAFRYASHPDYRYDHFGFRCARVQVSPVGQAGDVLIVTATPIESRAVIDAFAELTDQSARPMSVDDRMYHDLGQVQGAHVMLALTEMGSGGLGALQQTVQKGIAALRPQAVILVGIAFGVDERKQAIGDILVSQQLQLYESQRIGEGKIIPRGGRPHASSRLIDYFRRADLDWGDSNAKVRFGLVLSGEKLVDHLDYREQLQPFGPEAIGGEMEGAGLYVACQDAQVDWIVVKAICDWADGHKAEDIEARQQLAARNAAAFVAHALLRIPLALEEQTNMAYSAKTKLHICERLGVDWKSLADYFGIAPAERACFDRGREPQWVWEWLEVRRLLVQLAEGLRYIGRLDLVELLPDSFPRLIKREKWAFLSAEPAGPARGRQAERRPERGQPSGATDVEPHLLRLDAVPPQDRCPLPQAPAFLIRTDREHLTFRRLAKPAWANAIGRDRFGLWCEIAVDPGRGEPVIQRLRWIPPGRFWMGSPEEETQGLAKNDDERKWFDREHPRHLVTLTEGYWLFDTPCTQALWETVMEKNPSRFQSPTRPVEQVSWDGAQDFLKQLNGRIPDLNLVLPSEAQWEYACRAGTETVIYVGELAILGQCNAPALDSIAWYGGNSGVEFDLTDGEDSSGWPEKQYPHTRAGTRPVQRKRANPWGLYDMLGNVWEWCQDGMRSYDAEAQTNPTGSLDAGAGRIVRGGSWFDDAHRVRSASRFALHPDFRNDYIGLRCARVRGEPGQPTP